VSLGVVIYAAWWVYEQWAFRGATVAKVTEAAAALPREPAPAPAEGTPGVLDRAVDTVAFPDLKRFGWRPIGARSDTVAGRAAVTVYYARGSRQLRYTIVAGTGAVDNASATTTRTVFRGQLALSFVSGIPGGLTLALKRQGRNVIVTAPGADAAFGPTLVRLAAYRAGGRLAF
jgi:hypothetical protein